MVDYSRDCGLFFLSCTHTCACRSAVELYGALLRLKDWHKAQVQIVCDGDKTRLVGMAIIFNYLWGTC